MTNTISKDSLKTGMLSYARSLQISEGVFSAKPSVGDAKPQPVEVFEKGVRGQSSEFRTDNPGKSNPQVVEAAVVPLGCDEVYLEFSILFLPHSKQPWACDSGEVADAYRHLVKLYAEKGGFQYLARLYLWNIANARFAWRNRFQAENMRVTVSFDGLDVTFDPLKLEFDKPASAAELSAAAVADTPASAADPSAAADPVEPLIAWIAEGLQEERRHIQVTWKAAMNEGQEIFPSQEYLTDAEAKDAASRVYAKLPRFQNGRTVNQASMHSQKIGSALRHIDVWRNDGRAIAVNPYGGVQETGEVLRPKDSEKDFYGLRNKADTLFAELDSDKTGEQISSDVHFVIANLVRGGVFGQKS